MVGTLTQKPSWLSCHLFEIHFLTLRIQSCFGSTLNLMIQHTFSTIFSPTFKDIFSGKNDILTHS